MIGKEFIKELDKYLGQHKIISMNDVTIIGKLEKEESDDFVTRYNINNNAIMPIYHDQTYSLLNTSHSIVINGSCRYGC